MSDPLAETLFRPTIASPTLASAAPERTRGTRTRAGNAMSRTRSALLAGAARAVELSGTKIAMAQVAVSAGVAKATLYNHFRTREAVLDALVLDQVEQLAHDQVGKPLDEALAAAAGAIGTNPVRAALMRVEPAALAALGRIDDSAAGWQRAREAVDTALLEAGFGGTDTVLRWLSSFLVSPAGPELIAADVVVLIQGLPIRAEQLAGAPDTENRAASRPRPTPRSA